MDENAMKDRIGNLKEIVLDEKRLVTYVSLSKELCLHVNDTKVLMKGFLNEVNNNAESRLNINYIVSGLCTDNRARTMVCTEAELQGVKQSFQVIFYEHVYSINFGKADVDHVSIMATNKFDDLILCNGLVKNDLCTTRTPEEISQYQNAQNPTSSIKQGSGEPVRPKLKEEKTIKNSTSMTNGTTKQTLPKAPISDSEDDPQTIKNKTKVENKSESKKGIARFFNKQSQNSIKKTTAKSVKSTEDIVQKKIKLEPAPERMDVDDDSSSWKNTIKEQKVTKQNNVKKNNENKNTGKNTNLDKIKKNAKVDKKRKRVLTVSDSDSEDEQKDPFEEQEEHIDTNVDLEDEIPPTPTNNTVKITSGITNPRKKRKIVDKTYTDEEGYILTKKEEVYESCSDNEENIPKDNQQTIVDVKKELSLKGKASEPKNKKNKITPPQKGKQATLMSFFKKV